MKTFKEITEEISQTKDQEFARLDEKTYRINKDVDYLYKASGLKDLVKAIGSEDKDKIESILNSGTELSNGTMLHLDYSGSLKSQRGKKAHEMKPVSIKIGIFDNGSYYAPLEDFVQISINAQAFSLLQDFDFSYDAVNPRLGKKVRMFNKEFSEANVKGSIYHEIVHWMDDTFNDEMITKRLTSGKPKGKHNNINHTEFEINSQIHKIKELKRTLGRREFDNLDLKDMLIRLTSLSSNFSDYRNEKEFEVFFRKFISRLNREKLLPKNFKKVKYSEVKKILREI